MLMILLENLSESLIPFNTMRIGKRVGPNILSILTSKTKDFIHDLQYKLSTYMDLIQQNAFHYENSYHPFNHYHQVDQ